jgi:guanylate kinase
MSAYDEVKNKGQYDEIVINEDVGRAAAELARILDSS